VLGVQYDRLQQPKQLDARGKSVDVTQIAAMPFRDANAGDLDALCGHFASLPESEKFSGLSFYPPPPR
jgi:hypothetical protein